MMIARPALICTGLCCQGMWASSRHHQAYSALCQPVWPRREAWVEAITHLRACCCTACSLYDIQYQYCTSLLTRGASFSWVAVTTIAANTTSI